MTYCNGNELATQHTKTLFNISRGGQVPPPAVHARVRACSWNGWYDVCGDATLLQLDWLTNSRLSVCNTEEGTRQVHRTVNVSDIRSTSSIEWQ